MSAALHSTPCSVCLQVPVSEIKGTIASVTRRCEVAPSSKSGTANAGLSWVPVAAGKPGDEASLVRLMVRSPEGGDGALTVVTKRFAGTVLLEANTQPVEGTSGGAGVTPDMSVPPGCALLGSRTAIAPVTHLPYTYKPVGYGSSLPAVDRGSDAGRGKRKGSAAAAEMVGGQKASKRSRRDRDQDAGRTGS